MTRTCTVSPASLQLGALRIIIFPKNIAYIDWRRLMRRRQPTISAVDGGSHATLNAALTVAPIVDGVSSTVLVRASLSRRRVCIIKDAVHER